ncbi:MAG: hypothetical protein MJ188_08190 [Treponema sp.]|nr:hypothetical protein [Treponema sp.]
MNEKQWKIFCEFKKDFNEKIKEWEIRIPNLKELQKKAAEEAGTPAYSFETPVVYNRDLDKITEADCIKLIVIGDNPGKDEQLEKNNRYLVGQAGKIAEGFFRRNDELGVDFRKNVIILNKTPIHSAKTVQLRKIMQLGGKEVSDLIEESQLWMAKKTTELHRDLCFAAENKGECPELWLVGYSELKGKGFFLPYRDELKKNYLCNKEIWERVFVFQHFSMNRFSIDLKDFMRADENLNLMDAIHRLGEKHKTEVFDLG